MITLLGGRTTLLAEMLFIHTYDLCRLHMLQELEDGVKHLLAPHHGGKCDVLLHTWQARSQLIQVCELSLPNGVASLLNPGIFPNSRTNSKPEKSYHGISIKVSTSQHCYRLENCTYINVAWIKK